MIKIRKDFNQLKERSIEVDGLIEEPYGSVDWDVYNDPEFDDDGNEIETEDYVKIDNLFVDPKYRGQGKARELLTRAIKKIQRDYPRLKIKIVPEPGDDNVDLEKLSYFYDSFPELEVFSPN